MVRLPRCFVGAEIGPMMTALEWRDAGESAMLKMMLRR
jgi:hypothetical protein